MTTPHRLTVKRSRSVRERAHLAARSLRRAIFSGGFSPEAARVVRELRRESNPFIRVAHPTINLSFDLEFAINGHLWRGDIARALELGALARARLIPTLTYLQKKNIPCNVQVTTALLDPEFHHARYLPVAIACAVRDNPEMFLLGAEHRRVLAAHASTAAVALGVHGYSHREFTKLSPSEAEEELKRSVDLFEKSFGFTPRFMSFPRNATAYEALLPRFGIPSWRSGTQVMQAKHILERGVLLSPATLAPEDLTRLLSALRKLQPAPLLTVWGHFIEGDLDLLQDYIEVVLSSGFRFEAWYGAASTPPSVATP